MKNINRFLVLGLIAAAALFMTGMVSTTSIQQAYAANCHNEENLIGVCAFVCANVDVIGQNNKQQCQQ